jgi:hypothetical protein
MLRDQAFSQLQRIAEQRAILDREEVEIRAAVSPEDLARLPDDEDMHFMAPALPRRKGEPLPVAVVIDVGDARAEAATPARAHPAVQEMCRRAASNYLTLMDLARATGTHHSILQRWRNGTTAPRIVTLDRVNEAIADREAHLLEHPEDIPALREAYDRALRFEAAAATRPASVAARARRGES